MSKATITIGSNRTSATDLVNYPPAEYVDLPNKLASVKLIGDWPIYWPYLLGLTLRDKWYQGDMPEDQVTLENVEKYVIAYCEILTGVECTATGASEPQIKDGTEWAGHEVHRILMRSPFTVSIRVVCI
jgi:hypothetical protein